MREFLTFLTACAVLAIAKTLAAALGVALCILALLGIVAYPRQTFGLVASIGLLELALRAPAASAGAIGAVGVAIVIPTTIRRRPRAKPVRPAPLLLTDRRTAPENKI